MIDLAIIKGIVVPIITPLQADGLTVHERGVHQLVDRLISQGVHGIFPGGTTGEVWALDDTQWDRLIRFTVEATQGRVPVYAGVSHASTAGAVARARRAADLGADLIVSLAPYYAPPSQAEIVRHFQALADATPLPIIVYQYPGIVKASISLDTYVELAQLPSIVGLKDSLAEVTDFRHMIHTLRADGRDFRLFLGTDILVDVTVLMGGQGAVPSLGNVACAPLVETYEAAVRGEWARSAAVQTQALDLKAIYGAVASESVHGRIIPALKCALTLMGVEAGPPAAPMRAWSAQEAQAIEAILERSSVVTT